MPTHLPPRNDQVEYPIGRMKLLRRTARADSSAI